MFRIFDIPSQDTHIVRDGDIVTPKRIAQSKSLAQPCSFA